MCRLIFQFQLEFHPPNSNVFVMAIWHWFRCALDSDLMLIDIYLSIESCQFILLLFETSPSEQLIRWQVRWSDGKCQHGPILPIYKSTNLIDIPHSWPVSVLDSDQKPSSDGIPSHQSTPLGAPIGIMKVHFNGICLKTWWNEIEMDMWHTELSENSSGGNQNWNGQQRTQREM